ncbi:tetratricopeptide repeat protein [Acinetobacter boissieri]|uniref:tetratricopeptide repeat protein n=1 Tax=Acinetobacter boissieri TaxID=1219383 RepID=UPI003CC7A47A
MAQTNLGLAYKVGQGVSKSPTLAIDWFKKAAEQGNPIAQYNLGVMLLDGIGTNQNRSQGIKWLRQAADQGHSRAKSALEGLSY